MRGDGLKRLDADGLLDVAQRAESKLVDCAERVWVLNVVLNDIDVVGRGEESSEGRRG